MSNVKKCTIGECRLPYCGSILEYFKYFLRQIYLQQSWLEDSRGKQRSWRKKTGSSKIWAGDHLSFSFHQVTFDIENPIAVEKERPVQSQLPWYCTFAGYQSIVIKIFSTLFNVILQEIDYWEISQVCLQFLPWLDWDAKDKRKI